MKADRRAFRHPGPSEIIIGGDLGARDELAAFIGEHNIFRHIIQERLTTDICAVKRLEQTAAKRRTN